MHVCAFQTVYSQGRKRPGAIQATCRMDDQGFDHDHNLLHGYSSFVTYSNRGMVVGPEGKPCGHALSASQPVFLTSYDAQRDLIFARIESGNHHFITVDTGGIGCWTRRRREVPILSFNVVLSLAKERRII